MRTRAIIECVKPVPTVHPLDYRPPNLLGTRPTEPRERLREPTESARSAERAFPRLFYRFLRNPSQRESERLPDHFRSQRKISFSILSCINLKSDANFSKSAHPKGISTSWKYTCVRGRAVLLRLNPFLLIYQRRSIFADCVGCILFRRVQPFLQLSENVSIGSSYAAYFCLLVYLFCPAQKQKGGSPLMGLPPHTALQFSECRP